MIANYPKSVGFAWWLMERFWAELSAGAAERGWDSVIVYPDNAGSERAGTIAKIEQFLSQGALRDVIAIRRLIRSRNIRSLYLTDRPFTSWKYGILRACGVRSIVVHDHTPGDRPPIVGVRGGAKRLISDLPWVNVDLAVAVSPLMHNRMLRNGRRPRARTAVVTNGIDAKDVVPRARIAVVTKFGLSENDFIVCYAGRLTSYKRIDFAMASLWRLARNHVNLNPVLLIVGDGPDRGRLERIAQKQVPQVRIVFAGHQRDTWSILCGVDAVFHPSSGEGLSLAILEAMAAARPVIVPSVPSVSQSIEHDVSGLIYSDGDESSAAARLAAVAQDAALRERLGRRARTEVLTNYALTRTLLDLRRSVLPRLCPT